MSEQIAVRVLPATVGPGQVIKRYWYILLVAAVLLFYGWWWWAFYAFTDQHYAPLQPIPYSHKLHAGKLGIDCQYCHFNAARGKHAGVPPVSVCLGCHDPAKGGAGAGKPGVEKLLELVKDGQDTRLAYKDSEDLDYEGEGKVTKVGGVIHWNRIHRLPDHVYFRHEWHVQAGVACQTCHGPIEEMEVVKQYTPLSMGWCISCHRDNNYVGGPDYDGTDSTFTVGTANYDVLIARIAPDRVVPMYEGKKGKDKKKEGEADDEGRQFRGIHALSENLDDQPYNLHYFGKKQSEILRDTAKKNDDRFLEDPATRAPRWRMPDLPSIHAQFYNQFTDADGERISDLEAWLEGKGTEERARWYKRNIRRFASFQNAPTQCSTCHQ